MKVTSLALVLVATAQASLFDNDEDFMLQEEQEDFQDDRFLQNVDENGDIDEIYPYFMKSQENSDQQIDQMEQRFGNNDYDSERMNRRGNNNRRRGGRKGRGKGKGKGRRGRKNRKQKRGTFDVEKNLAEITKRAAKKEEKLEDKCERKLGWAEKICAQLPEKTDCQKWALAQEVRCQAYGNCRISNMVIKGKCYAEFKHRMISFMSEKVVARTQMDDKQIGQCFTAVLQKAESCSSDAAQEYATALQGAAEITDDELSTAKAALQKERKLKRQQRKKQIQMMKNKRRNERHANRQRNKRRGRRGQNEFEEQAQRYQNRNRRGQNTYEYEEEYQPLNEDETDILPRRFN